MGNGSNNALDGGAGNDTLISGYGTDTMTGGDGDDTFYVFATGDLVKENANGGIDTVDSLVSYTLSANVENLTLMFSASINGTGNTFANTITGNAGANVLAGAAGKDTLSGGDGNDTLIGGAGKDQLTGGAGDDHFTFSAKADSGPAIAGRDVITDFAHGDLVDVSAIDANTHVAGDQAFTFVTSFSHAAGQLDWTQTAPSAFLIQGDTNGDGAADFSIQVNGALQFTAIAGSDFIL